MCESFECVLAVSVPVQNTQDVRAAHLTSIFEIICGTQRSFFLTYHFHNNLQVSWQLLLYLISHACLKYMALNRQQNSACLSTSKYDTSST